MNHIIITLMIKTLNGNSLKLMELKIYFYFKCSSIKCGGFGMINRFLKDQIFVLTKEHKLEYYKHSYYKLKYNYEMLINNKLTKNDFDNEEIRYNLFKIYFEENKFHDEKQCIELFKNRFNGLFNITEQITLEIKNAKKNVKYQNN